MAALLSRHPSQAGAVRRRLDALAAADLLDAQDRADLPPALGDFEPLEVLGRGGMGVVYRARQKSLGREVALKVVRPEHLHFPESRARFRREVESVARLEHPGIVPVYVVGEALGVPYFAMELVAGVTLEQAIADLAPRGADSLTGADLAQVVTRRLGNKCRAEAFAGSWVATCCRIVAQVADALDHAHRRGVLHRDVKPSNIMLTSHGGVRLLDFGLATVEGADQLTRAGAPVGSLPYMAPEQVAGEGARVDARTDVYAAGVLLYELLALRPAFGSPTSEGTRRRILAGAYEPLRRHADVPWDVATLCTAAMDHDPARRYQTAEELGQDLRRCLSHRPIRARRPSAWLRARRWTQRHPAAAMAAILGSALFLGTSLYAVDMHSAHRDLERARAREQGQRERAEANLEQAIAAIDEILGEDREAPFGDWSVDDPARQRLLEQALRLYENLLAREAEHAALAVRVVKTRWRVGQLRMDLGLWPEAEAALRTAMDQGAIVRQSNADATVARTLCLDIATDLVRVLVARGAAGEAVAHAESLVQALEADDNAGQDPGADPVAGRRRVAAWHILARARHQSGAIDAAITAARQAVLLGEQLVAAAPGDAEAQASLATSVQTLAYWIGFHRAGDHVPLFERALALVSGAIQRRGTPSPGGQLARSRIHSAWAHVDNRAERWDAAIGHLGQAQAILVLLMGEHPSRVPFAEVWLANQYQLGWLLKQTGDAARADTELRHGLAVGEEALGRSNGHAGLAFRLATLQTEVARADGPDADALWEAAHRNWVIARTASPNPTYDQQIGAFFDYRARHAHRHGRGQQALELAAQACAHHRAAMASHPDPGLHRVRLAGALLLTAAIHIQLEQPEAAMAALSAAITEAQARRSELVRPEFQETLGARADYRALVARARAADR